MTHNHVRRAARVVLGVHSRETEESGMNRITVSVLVLVCLPILAAADPIYVFERERSLEVFAQSYGWDSAGDAAICSFKACVAETNRRSPK